MNEQIPPPSARLPHWIRTRLPAASTAASIRRRTYAQGLATVCREARCPNQAECSSRGTATFLILGDRCTRDCRFCAVRHGTPLPVNPEEPFLVAAATADMGLRHAVVTSVTRDDLPDGGAELFVAVIRAIRSCSPGTTIEVLIPDFQGDWQSLKKVIDARPDVINHNVETVPRLYPVVRWGASYERSLELLDRVYAHDRGIVTKSGLMAGMGETRAEITHVIRDMVGSHVTVLTIGQYLRPSVLHHPVDRYLPPHEFDELKDLALAEGIKRVAAGPLVRSSYKAGLMFAEETGTAE
ncbi:MAG: lipoyl synthase [Desulfomonilaceae bacterium]|nr:lipoyl synthase [Desulfomonilaceae bacterium]